MNTDREPTPEQPTRDELISKGELAKLLNVTTRTVTKWLRSLRLPHIKAGRMVGFDWQEVKSYLKRHYGKGGE